LAVLLKILEKNIHDGRFIRLVSNMLKAGYLEGWKFNQTISGTPQGGVISLLLANIMETSLLKTLACKHRSSVNKQKVNF